MPKDSLAFFRVRTHGNVAHLHAFLHAGSRCAGLQLGPAAEGPYLVPYSVIIILLQPEEQFRPGDT